MPDTNEKVPPGLTRGRWLELRAALPAMCYADNTLHCQGPGGPPPVIGIKRGESGYYPIYTTKKADDLNRSLGVTKAQRDAMLAGSMFGWDTKGADPATWEARS